MFFLLPIQEYAVLAAIFVIAVSIILAIIFKTTVEEVVLFLIGLTAIAFVFFIIISIIYKIFGD